MTEAAAHEALSLAGALVAVDELREAWQGRRHPAGRWLVLGRQAVGKSRLINRVLGADAPVGLGGVTREVRAYADPELVLVDTPGLEGEFDALDLIDAHLPTVDGVVWVVDGLAPLTALERRIVDRGVPPEVAIVAVVSRLDLVDEAERPAVLARVVHLCRHRPGVRVLSGLECDAVIVALAEPEWRRSPVRLGALHRSVAGVLRSLQYLVEPEQVAASRVVEQVRTAWRHEVATALAAMVDRVTSGEIVFRDAALDALADGLGVVATRVRDELYRAVGAAPDWMPEAPETLDMWGQAQDLVAGTPGLVRALRETAAGWAVEGELAWASVLSHPEVRDRQRRQEAVEEALGSVRRLDAALPDWSRTD